MTTSNTQQIQIPRVTLDNETKNELRATADIFLDFANAELSINRALYIHAIEAVEVQCRRLLQKVNP